MKKIAIDFYPLDAGVIKNGVVDISKGTQCISWGKSLQSKGLLEHIATVKAVRPRRKDGKIDRRYRKDTYVAKGIGKVLTEMAKQGMIKPFVDPTEE